MRQRIMLPSLCALVLVAARAESTIAEVTAKKTEKGVAVEIDGQPFTEYLTCAGTKPVLWPIIGPTGKPMTRQWPMGEGKPEEREDHIHHRSLWFTHGDVNGVNFWSEHPGAGKIVHRDFLQVQGGQQAVITARNDWLSSDGKKIMVSDCEITTAFCNLFPIFFICNEFS